MLLEICPLGFRKPVSSYDSARQTASLAEIKAPSTRSWYLHKYCMIHEDTDPEGLPISLMVFSKEFYCLGAAQFLTKLIRGFSKYPGLNIARFFDRWLSRWFYRKLYQLIIEYILGWELGNRVSTIEKDGDWSEWENRERSGLGGKVEENFVPREKVGRVWL